MILFNAYQGKKAEGDCDDHSMFAAAIGAALGAVVQFVCVAADPSEPGVLSHIYTIIDGIPCDASHGEFAGWQVPVGRVTRREVYPLASGSPLFLIALVGAVAWYFMRGSF